MDRKDEMIKISDEILCDIESNRICLEDIVTKCKKIARLKDDNEAMNWFYLELNGYDRRNTSAINITDYVKYARLAGRTSLERIVSSGEEEERYWTLSIPEIESQINSAVSRFEKLVPPESYNPPIQKSSMGRTSMFPESSWERPTETYSDVVRNMEVMKTTLAQEIKDKKALLSRIKNNIYEYVLNINVQLKFEGVIENIFQTAKTKVDDVLRKMCPDVLRNLLSAYDRLGDKPEEWTQALNSCRLALKAFADAVFPSSEDKYKMKDKTVIEVSNDKFKNRLYAFIDKSSKSVSRRNYLVRVDDLCNRVNVSSDMLAKGAHKELSRKDVEMSLINTYLLIADLVDLRGE